MKHKVSRYSVALADPWGDCEILKRHLSKASAEAFRKAAQDRHWFKVIVFPEGPRPRRKR